MTKRDDENQEIELRFSLHKSLNMNELDCSYHREEFLTNFSRLYRTAVLIFDRDFQTLLI
jgi:hypothetical protein